MGAGEGVSFSFNANTKVLLNLNLYKGLFDFFCYIRVLTEAGLRIVSGKCHTPDTTWV